MHIYDLFSTFGYSLRYSVTMQATTGIFFQRAPAKRTKEDLIPVKLRVQRKEEKKYYSLKEKISNDKWMFIDENDIHKVMTKSPKGQYKDIRTEYDRIVREAENIIKEIPVFSFNLFEDRFFNKAGSWNNVFSALWTHIQDLKNEGRFGYAESFQSTLRTVKEFHTGKNFHFNHRTDKVENRKEIYLSGKSLNFVDITPRWLKNFELWLNKREKSRSTIGIYTRNIRVLFNLAINEHKVKAEYPFSKYTPKSAKKRKLALTAHEIGMIANYKTDDPREQFYKDVFMFSFMANGANLADIARLKYSDIEDSELVFVREKTKGEEAEEDKLHIPITKTMQSIIAWHGNRTVGHDAYIFPVLKPTWSDKQKYLEIKQLTKLTNKYVSRIASAVGIKKRVTSYAARHSWASISKNSGTSTEFISEALGHSSVLVTKSYLKSFEKSTRQEHAEKMEELIKSNVS